MRAGVRRAALTGGSTDDRSLRRSPEHGPNPILNLMGDLLTRLQRAVGDAYRIEKELGGGGGRRSGSGERVSGSGQDGVFLDLDSSEQSL